MEGKPQARAVPWAPREKHDSSQGCREGLADHTDTRLLFTASVPRTYSRDGMEAVKEFFCLGSLLKLKMKAEERALEHEPQRGVTDPALAAYSRTS